MTWDICIRLGHWAIVGAVAFQIYSGEDISLRDTHSLVGTLILGWVIFRIIWGFVGPTHARFSDFVKSPVNIFKSALALFRGRIETKGGHTAFGGVGVIVLMSLLAVIATTGLFSTDDIFYDGPLNSLVSNDVARQLTILHKDLAKPILLIFIGAHVSAVLLHQFWLKERLVQGMIHGRKAHAVDDSARPAKIQAKGLALLTLCLAGTWFGVQAIA